jgi:hypothetical protein
MKKLRLDLDSLVVESFASANTTSRTGRTIHGHWADEVQGVTNFSCALTDDDYSCWMACPVSNAPANTCWNTCGANDTCHQGHCLTV